VNVPESLELGTTGRTRGTSPQANARIAVVTDEVSSDVETALELVTELGIDAVELRGVGTERLPRVSAYWSSRLPGFLERYGTRVVSISPGLFKIPFASGVEPKLSYDSLAWADAQSQQQWRAARSMIEESLELARRLGSPMISCFGFVRGSGDNAPDCPAEVISLLRDAAIKAENAGVLLVLENEEGCWADTGAATGRIVQRVAHRNLRVLWDPANAYVAGEIPFPDGYEHVRMLIQHVQFKDVRRLPSGNCEFVVDGAVDWAGQIEALVRDGYGGYISIETHAKPRVRTTHALLFRLRELLGLQQRSGTAYAPSGHTATG
jgi:sugar phosphate isomerase/epimerase